MFSGPCFQAHVFRPMFGRISPQKKMASYGTVVYTSVILKFPVIMSLYLNINYILDVFLYTSDLIIEIGSIFLYDRCGHIWTRHELRNRWSTFGALLAREALRLMKEDTSNSAVMLHIVGGVQQISRDQVPNSAFNKWAVAAKPLLVDGYWGL